VWGFRVSFVQFGRCVSGEGDDVISGKANAAVAFAQQEEFHA